MCASRVTAKRWQRVAWGEPTSDSEAGVTPGIRTHKNSFPGGDLIRETTGLRHVLKANLGLRLLAPRLAILAPGYHLPLLRSCRP
jgi:hypothetical protein